MKLEKLKLILAEMGRPYAFMVHRNQPDLPFFTYFFMGSDNFVADNMVYVENHGIGIQIISTKKEFELERRFKDALNREKIVWDQMPDYYDSEKQTFISHINI